MKCPVCGKEFEGNFCPECGYKANEYDRCPICDSKHNDGEKFCPTCGYHFEPAKVDNVFGELDAPPSDDDCKSGDSPAKQAARTKPEVPAAFWALNTWPTIFSVYSWLAGLAMTVVAYIMFAASDLVVFFFALLAAVAVGVIDTILVTAPCRMNWSKKFKNKKALNPRSNYIINIVMSLVFTVFTIAMMIYTAISGNNIGLQPSGIAIAFFVIFIALQLVSLMLYIIWWNKHKKRIMVAYYGTENPRSGDKVILTREDLTNILMSYRAECREYWLSKPRMRAARKGEQLSQTKAKNIIWIRSRGVYIVSPIISILLAALFIGGACLFYMNIFRIDKVNLISVGDTQTWVRRVLLNPYETEDAGHVWKYYDNDYIELIERNESFDPGDINDTDDFENAFNEAVEFENAVYKYIEVNFETVENGLRVVSILLDTNRVGRYNNTEEKTIESFSVTSAEIELNAYSATVVYVVEYTDGSYLNGKTINTSVAYPEVADEVGKQVTVQWIDPFGNELTAPATVIDSNL